VGRASRSSERTFKEMEIRTDTGRRKKKEKEKTKKSKKRQVKKRAKKERKGSDWISR
jgi:hypothetical protein